MTREQIAALLPHGEGMCLLDAVAKADENGITCTALVRSDHPLRHHGEVSSIMALEYGAQATGLWAALRHGVDEKPKEGYVLAVRNFKLHQRALPQNALLTITVDKQLLGEDSAICAFAVASEHAIIAEGRITLKMGPAS